MLGLVCQWRRRYVFPDIRVREVSAGVPGLVCQWRRRYVFPDIKVREVSAGVLGLVIGMSVAEEVCLPRH